MAVGTLCRTKQSGELFWDKKELTRKGENRTEWKKPKGFNQRENF